MTRILHFLSFAALVACADVVSSSVGCERCRIIRSTIVSLDQSTAGGVGRGAATTPDGHFILIGPLSALEFDAYGSLVDSIPPTGNRGSAHPITAVTSFDGDSLIIAQDGFLLIVGPNRAQVDSVLLPANTTIRALHVMSWPNRLMFSGVALGRAGLFTARVDAGFLKLDASFRPPEVAATVRAPDYRFARKADGGVWAVEIHSYDLSEFSADGSLVSRFERKPHWFGKPTRGRAKGGLRSTVAAVWFDPDDRLWVYSIEPTAKAGAAWRSREARRPGGTVRGLDTMYETVVEVLDPRTRTMLASGSIPDVLIGLTADGRALFRNREPDAPVRVQQLQLQDNQTKH